MKKIKYLWVLFLLIPFSCVDNDSRYGDTEIDEIKIEGIPAYKEIEIGGKLSVSPTVTTKFGEESDLSYVWYKYNQEQSVADTLSFEKNLDVVIADVLPGVQTTLTFKVIDNRTGVYTLNNSTFTTVGKYSGGTLMLCMNDGQYDLSMLKKDGITFYENIYSLANNGAKLGAKSKQIILPKNYVRNSLPYKAVIVTCGDETGGIYIDPDAFVRKNSMREKFVLNEDMLGDLIITGRCNGQGTDYLIVNGKVHGRDFGFNDVANWNPELVFLAEPRDYSAVLASQPTGYPFYASPLFFDNLNGRFMINTNGGYFSLLGGVNNDFSKFNPGNMEKGLELIVSGSMNSSLDETWAMMKNTNTGGYILLTYKFIFNDDWTYTFVSLSKTVLSAPGLNAATVFIAGTKPNVASSNPWIMEPTGISDVFLYLSGNKVYAFNVKSLSEGVIVDGDLENYTLTGIDCTELSWPTAADPEATAVQLTVAMKDNSLNGKQGGIAVYHLNSIGGLSAQKIYAKAGFCDEVAYTLEKQE